MQDLGDKVFYGGLVDMSIIDHESAAEETRRPGYRRRRLSGYEDGFQLTFDYHIVDPGSGAPPHHHTILMS